MFVSLPQNFKKNEKEIGRGKTLQSFSPTGKARGLSAMSIWSLFFLHIYQSICKSLPTTGLIFSGGISACDTTNAKAS